MTILTLLFLIALVVMAVVGIALPNPYTLYRRQKNLVRELPFWKEIEEDEKNGYTAFKL